MKKVVPGLFLLLASCLARAEQPAVEAYAYVSALQPPVWVSHKGGVSALGASSPVLVNEEITTGNGARVHLALADGSLLKLGENTRLRVTDLQLSRDVLRGNFNLLQGTLRCTTSQQAAKISRELIIRMGDRISVQLTEADLWAKSGATEDRMYLLKGAVAIETPQQPAVNLNQNNSVYVLPRDQTAKPVTISVGTRFLAQTELSSLQPALQSTGPYRIVLAIYPDEITARERVEKYTRLGYPVDMQRIDRTNNTSAFKVTLDGLTNRADANLYADILKERLKLLNPAVEAPSQ